MRDFNRTWSDDLIRYQNRPNSLRSLVFAIEIFEGVGDDGRHGNNGISGRITIKIVDDVDVYNRTPFGFNFHNHDEARRDFPLFHRIHVQILSRLCFPHLIFRPRFSSSRKLDFAYLVFFYTLFIRCFCLLLWLVMILLGYCSDFGSAVPVAST